MGFGGKNVGVEQGSEWARGSKNLGVQHGLRKELAKPGMVRKCQVPGDGT